MLAWNDNNTRQVILHTVILILFLLLCFIMTCTLYTSQRSNETTTL